jgi:hypothetical protein
MSKKKAAKKAAKKTKPAVKRVTVKKSVSKLVSRTALAPAKSTAAATIFVYDTAQGTRVRTSPQLLATGDGWVEWTVVNLTSGPMPEVDITWVDGSPWGGSPIKVANGNCRKDIINGNKGRFKYNVTCNGYTEDPEIEYPVN